LPPPPDPDAVDGVAPDGSPVEVYLRLGAGDTPALIHGAVPPGATVLELGCGVGRITEPLAALGHRIVAVDNSPEMLDHVRSARTVLADVETLALGEVFDVVVLASHFVNSADPSVRRALFDVCVAHARPAGLVLIERYEPETMRAVTSSRSEVDGVAIWWHDVVHRGDVFDAAVTYELDGHSWTQRFSAEILDDDRLAAEAAESGLMFDAWLDRARKWARFVARPGWSPSCT
jgi:SAM-dependent methyltransferase